MKNEFPKILICCPSSNHKSYCDKDWINNTLEVNYPNFKIVIFDNSDDNGEYRDSLNTYYKEKYNSDQFECIKSDTSLCNGLISKICKSHNDCRDYALANSYDYMLHLESDVFLKENFLQELILHKKQVVGALYYRDEGRGRRLMLQYKRFRSHDNIYTTNADIYDDAVFVDGRLKEAAHIGLGCVLIRRDVLEKIPFRYVPGVEIFPDSFFAEDAYKYKYKIWADTSLPPCEHRNSNWQLNVYNKDNKW